MATAEISEVKNWLYKIAGVLFTIAISIITFFAVRTLASYDQNIKDTQAQIEKLNDKLDKKFEAINAIQTTQLMQGARLDFFDYRLGAVEKKVGIETVFQQAHDKLDKTKQFEKK